MPRVASSSLSRAEWLAARALLASRRLRPILPSAIGVALVVLLMAGWWPRAGASGAERMTAEDSVPAEADTVALRAAQARLDAQRRRVDSTIQASSVTDIPSDTGRLSAAERQERDSLLTVRNELDDALDRAAKSPLVTSYRTLARTAALRSLGTVSVLMDTLDLLEEVRRTLDPVAAPQREFAQLSERTHAIGASLQAIGQARRAVLNRRLVTLGQTDARSAVDTTALRRAERDSLRLRAAQLDSLLRVARQWHADRGPQATVAPARARAIAVSLLPALGALFLAGVAVFTIVLALEARRPTIAHAREVERITGLPVLATIRESHVPSEGRARLQAGQGADPFRMVYLALTVGEPRARTVCVTGTRPEPVAATAGRLAVSAAAEERSTLVMDLTGGSATTAQYFGWKDGPGFSEAIAGVRLWREVATPIGASEGTDIDLVAAGANRADTAEAIALESNRREYLAFLGEHDFTVLAAATTASAALAARVAERPCTIVITEAARTRVSQLRHLLEELVTADVRLSGIVLFDR